MHQAQHIPHALLVLDPLIQKYGYLAVAGLVTLEDFGVPVPGETLVIAAAFYAGIGQLNIILVVLVAIIGAIIGDNIGYAIGYYGGHPIVEKLGKYIFLTPARINQLEAFFTKHGGKIVVVARFIEGLRQLNGILAGLSEMPWLKFILYNTIGASIWVIVWSVIGYYSGQHIDTYLRYQLYVTILAIAGALGFITYHFIKHRTRAKNQTSHSR